MQKLTISLIGFLVAALSSQIVAQSRPSAPVTFAPQPRVASPPPPVTQSSNYWYFVSTGEQLSNVVTRVRGTVPLRPKETAAARRTRVANAITLLNPQLNLKGDVSAVIGNGRLVVVPDAAAVERTSSSQLAFHWITCKQLAKLSEIVPSFDPEVRDLIKELQAQDHVAPQHSTLFHVVVFPSLLSETHLYYIPNLPDGNVTDRVIGADMRRKLRQYVISRYDYLLGSID